MVSTMTTDQLCHRYLAALNAGDLKAVLDLFTPDAQVSSPLYGLRDAQTFYAELFEDTSRSDTRLLNIFDQSSSGSAIALHFEYDWTLASGKMVKFECVDVFEITDDGERFKKITIIYDTAHLRSDFDASKKI